jgi:isoaspartyl peptidase/L-asparaginase-like protein (Ntn-hydrolase superfamily)
MWTPKQLLSDETVEALRIGGFSPVEIEFLGWLNGTAQALNNSKNPVKAAHTILAKPKMEKLVDGFTKKKKASVYGDPDAPDHNAISQKLRKLEQWQTEEETIAQVNDKAKAACAEHD